MLYKIHRAGRGGALLLGLGFMASLCFTGCQKEAPLAESVPATLEVMEDSEDYQAASKAVDEIMDQDPDQELIFQWDYDPLEAVAVKGDYNKMKLDSRELTVTEEDLEYALLELRQQNAEYLEITDRGAQAGDRLVIDFSGYCDDTLICKETGYELTLGEGIVNEKFEDVLYDAVPGEEKRVNLRYRGDYEDETLAGKKVSYQITIRKLAVVELPELTDQMVARNTPYDSLADYKEALRTQFQTERNMDAVSQWLEEHTRVRKIPEVLQKACEQDMLDYFTYVAEYYYDTDLEGLMAKAGYKSAQDMLDKNQDTIAYSAKNELIYAFIAEKEGISSDYGSYQEFLKGKATVNQCKDLTDLFMIYSESQLRLEFLKSLVTDRILQNIGPL